jgi:NAD(P)-dependent dehydrogenase (short-subunit alcohol dehydrogenase family)
VTASATGSGTVIVTGSSTGLGLETSLYLAERGFDVYATLRHPDMTADVEKAAAERGVTLHTWPLDLTAPESINAAVAGIAGEAGSIFALVNNGGVGLRACLEDTTDADMRAVFEANVFGTIAATKAVLPHMRAAGRGRIVTLSSVGGRISSFGVSVYCASKFAVEGLAEGLALEVAPFGIQSILIEPGMIKTTRWTTNRGTTRRALDPESPYFRLFQASEAVADRVVNRSKTKAPDVAAAIYQALTDEKPRLRYVVGRPAAAAIKMRRFLPERTFERVYFGPLVKKIAQGVPAAGDGPA